jgi:hypothetical protein
MWHLLENIRVILFCRNSCWLTLLPLLLTQYTTRMAKFCDDTQHDCVAWWCPIKSLRILLPFSNLVPFHDRFHMSRNNTPSRLISSNNCTTHFPFQYWEHVCWSYAPSANVHVCSRRASFSTVLPHTVLAENLLQ